MGMIYIVVFIFQFLISPFVYAEIMHGSDSGISIYCVITDTPKPASTPQPSGAPSLQFLPHASSIRSSEEESKNRRDSKIQKNNSPAQTWPGDMPQSSVIRVELGSKSTPSLASLPEMSRSALPSRG